MKETDETCHRTVADQIALATSALLQSIPFTGGLARYLDEYYPSQQKREIERLRNALLEESERVAKVDCDLHVLGALVQRILAESLRTSSEAKRAAFRNILLNYAAGKPIEERKLDCFLQLLVSFRGVCRAADFAGRRG